MAITAETIQLGPWEKGVRYDKPVEDVEPDELFAMENVRLGTAHQAEMRPGTDQYQDAAAIGGSPTLTACGQMRFSSSSTSVFMIAGAVFYEYSSGWTDRTGGETITAGDDNTFEWVNANGTWVGTNGVDDSSLKWTAAAGNIAALDVDSRFTKGKHIAWWDNRLWIGNVNGNTSQLWYSEIGDLETWKATNFYNFGSEIHALVPMQNGLTVHTEEEGIWTLLSTHNALIPYDRQQRTTQGGLAGRSVIHVPANHQLMVREDGIYRWEGEDLVEKISYQLDDGYWDNINVDRLGQSFALYFPRENEAWFFLPYGASQTNMNHIMVYSVRHDRWHGPYTGWERNCAALIDEKPHAGDFSGQLFDHDDASFSDDGTAISAYFETGAPAPQDASTRVRWLYGRYYYDDKGDYEVTVQQKSVGLSGTTRSLNMGSTAGALDSFVLDTDTLGSVQALSSDLDLSGYDPHTSVRISHNVVNQSFTFRRIHLQHKVIGRKRKRFSGWNNAIFPVQSQQL